MTEANKLRVDMLNGCEVQSLNYEGCVYIKNDKVYRNGEVIDTLNTNEKAEELWQEYKENEGF